MTDINLSSFIWSVALTVLSVMLRTAVEWGVIERVPCTIKLLKAPKTTAVSDPAVAGGGRRVR